jgi:putative ABC transport system substrate-binding protein
MTRVERRAFLVGTLALLPASLAAEAQTIGKVYRIGILSTTGVGTWPPKNWEPFQRALHDLGYVEGQTAIVEYRSAQGRYDRLPDLAAELVRLKVDVIVAGTTPGALAAQKATTTIPIVFSAVSDPVGSGVVVSLSRPGGNITGVTHVLSMLGGKRLQLLREVLPTVTVMAVLTNPDPANRSATHELPEVEAAARAMGVTLHVLRARTPDQLDGAFAAMTRKGVKALLVGSDAMFYVQRRRILELATKHRLPAIHGGREAPEAGGLMSYGADFGALALRAAGLVDKILKGAKPADLPVEQPTKFEFVINLKTAKALGLTIPPAVLARADEVIE